MKKIYLLGGFIALLLASSPAQAQYTFTDTKLQPYTQNFDNLSGTVLLTGNHLAAPAPTEVYAQATFPGALPNYSPTSFGANDGGTNTANYYHFGYASGANTGDRSFGGIAGTTFTANGIGYVGIRLKNSTSVSIKNLEIEYAMEQWYNSGRLDAAQVAVSYLTGTSVTSLLDDAGAWTSLAELSVDAPSTATAVTNRDGNSATNRRVRKTTLMNLNLAAGQEIMLRWAYTLNTATNGNGLSIDDVVITPETNVFYANPTTGALNTLTTWNTATDGTGVAPASFAAANQTFYVMGNTPSASPTLADATDRITTLSWAVSGDNSKIVVGTKDAPASLRIEANRNVTAFIDVSPGSYLVHRRTINNGPINFTFVSLATSSTVEYNSAGNPHTVQAAQYGNLVISGNNTDRTLNAKTLAGNTIVAGTLSLNPGSNLVLGNNDLTVLSTGRISGGANTAYVLTNGTGRLRLQVPRAASTTTPGSLVSFPIGSTYTSYTPITLQQTSIASDDVFETRVIDNVYAGYDNTTYAPTGAQLTKQVVNKTWLVSKEVPINPATVTMTTQWNAADAATGFAPLNAHINHYTNDAWDTYSTEIKATGTGPYLMKRSGITSFSPFGVSSQVAGTLPVVLTAFAAQRTSTGVTCAWRTASEQNSQAFSVERSLNGVAFTTLGSVPAAGSSATPRSYTFLDATPLSTTAYYRLRQTDQDGQQAYSAVVTVAGNALASAITAAPNPTAGPLDLWATAQVTQATVVNVLGVVVLTQSLATPSAHVSLNLGSLAAGVYLVRLTTATGPQVVRVIKH